MVKLIGIRVGGAGRAAAPLKFGLLRVFGKQEKFRQSKFLKKYACACVVVVFMIDIFLF